MPLFMDRHDIPGVSAENVAQAHLADLGAEARHAVRFLTYWFDPDRGEAFCLAQAPTSEAMTAVHRETHGLIPNEIIPVSEDQVLRFLGRIIDPVDDARVGNPFRAILFTDLEGSTSLLESVGEAAYMLLLTEHDLIIRRALVTTRGREVKHTGDGIMASFDSVPNSLECALAIQEGFTARGSNAPWPALRVRIGIAAGEPVDHNDDLFGATVTLASRICAAADGGRILASDIVCDLGRQRGFRFDSGQERTLKGFSSPVCLFELLGLPGPDEAVAAPPQTGER
jgi:class 3 adenylate cyclase